MVEAPTQPTLASLAADFLSIIDGEWGRMMAQAISRKADQGWRRGGCLVLAEGVSAWLGSDHCQILGLWRHGPPSHPAIVPHHVFVRAGAHYLDGNGILTRTAFEAAWTRDGAVDFARATIAPYVLTPDERPIIPRDLVVSTAIATRLRVAIDPAQAIPLL